MTDVPRPLSILIAALGGEGGGVLVDWLVDAARRAGLPVQATSVPGVAQRTGATSYYLECLPGPVAGGLSPVFALSPVPGRVDVVVASELLEAGRMIERGLVSADRTLLITARHRIYTTIEKMQPGDGRIADDLIHAAARRMARRYVAIDLQSIAAAHHTVISAAMFGALAGSGALPWSREHCEAAIRAGGIGIETSLAGFAAAFDAAAAPPDATGIADARIDDVAAGEPVPASDIGATMADARVNAASHDPARELDEVMTLARARLVDHQDAAYADLYRARIAALLADGPPVPAHVEAARQLALWMTYEDVIRVADLKTRPERLQRVRAEAQAGPGDIVVIRDHLKPGLDEIAAIAPASIGRRLRRHASGRPIGARGRGFALATTSITGYLLLRVVASLRRFRRASLRFAEEQEAIERWLDALARVLPTHPGFALVLAELPRLRKGYSDTWLRGVGHYERIFAMLVEPLAARDLRPGDEDAQRLRAAIDEALGTPPSAAAPVVPSAAMHAAGQPIRWHARDIERPRDASK